MGSTVMGVNVFLPVDAMPPYKQSMKVAQRSVQRLLAMQPRNST